MRGAKKKEAREEKRGRESEGTRRREGKDRELEEGGRKSSKEE